MPLRPARALGPLILALLAVPAARAQNAVRTPSAGVFNSAETVNPGNFKVAGGPAVWIGNDFQAWGGLLRAGYGFAPRVDGELKAAFYDGYTGIGADVEVGLVREPRFDLSFAVGGHYGRADVGNEDLSVPGLDLTGLASVLVAPRLELYGGVDASFEFPAEPDDDTIPVEDYARVHLVPGFEFRVSRQVDFLAEIGLGLNARSDEYVALGLAFYLR